MTIRTITLPTFLLEDDELEGLITKSMEIMTELAGESETGDLPPVINALRSELEMRGRTITLEDDGSFSFGGPKA